MSAKMLSTWSFALVVSRSSTLINSLTEPCMHNSSVMLRESVSLLPSCKYLHLELNHVGQLTGHAPVLEKGIGFGTPVSMFGDLKVKSSSPTTVVVYLPSGQKLGLVFPSVEVDERRRQKTN